MAFQAVSWVYGWEMMHHRQSNLQGTTRRRPALPHQQIHACLFVCYKCPTEFKGDNGKVEKVTSKECFRVWKTKSSMVMFLFNWGDPFKMFQLRKRHFFRLSFHFGNFPLKNIFHLHSNWNFWNFLINGKQPQLDQEYSWHYVLSFTWS